MARIFQHAPGANGLREIHGQDCEPPGPFYVTLLPTAYLLSEETSQIQDHHREKKRSHPHGQQSSGAPRG